MGRLTESLCVLLYSHLHKSFDDNSTTSEYMYVLIVHSTSAYVGKTEKALTERPERASISVYVLKIDRTISTFNKCINGERKRCKRIAGFLTPLWNSNVFEISDNLSL